MMKMQSKLIALLVLYLGVTFSSCMSEPSDAVNQDKIFTHYELFYNANEDKTYARAWFRFSNAFGTLLELADPSEVTFDGDPLTWNKVLAYYEREYAGNKMSGTFSWTDTEGNTFNNTININDIAFGTLPATVTRDSAFEIPWVGAPLGANEFVIVLVNGENENDAQVQATNDQGAQSVIVPKNEMQQVGAGPGTIYMDRHNSPGLVEATSAGGILTGRYRAENAMVNFD